MDNSEVELDAETRAALDDWIHVWQKPKTVMDWEKLLQQAESIAALSHKLYCQTVELRMPRCFVQKAAERRYRNFSRYERIRRRVYKLKDKLARELLVKLGAIR